MQFIAKTFQGLESALAGELRDLGATAVEELTRAVSFEGGREWVYRANLELRTALRILIPIHSFTCTNEKELYEGVRAIEWRNYLSPDDTLAVEAVVNSTFFNHSRYVALKTKDAIVDQLRDQFGQRPNVDLKSPTLPVQVHIRENQCSVLLDSSGEPLFKRGYRIETGPAPLNEVLAAGMLKLAGWPMDVPFLDPMCGSGTLPIEAALMATHTPSQWYREHFAFQKWKDFDQALWKEVKNEAWANKEKEAAPIFGSDIHPNAIRIAQVNAAHTDIQHLIRWEHAPLERCAVPEGKGLMVFNPPYNERMPVEEIEELYQMIGSSLKHRFPGYQAWVLTGNEKGMHAIGLRPSRRIALFNGAIPCKFLKFELYDGSKKFKKEAVD
ncbi:MAG: class I SAM-dependent RNA methyltransferase [Saprospirales bacterium]|nr:class I SAM-dependent RNA methyltransferase [Saprospirales bacterium]MBK6905167.1 class I SAM-dependent RNA methyltransferase [Saprospirales bacterium]